MFYLLCKFSFPSRSTILLFFQFPKEIFKIIPQIPKILHEIRKYYLNVGHVASSLKLQDLVNLGVKLKTKKVKKSILLFELHFVINKNSYIESKLINKRDNTRIKKCLMVRPLRTRRATSFGIEGQSMGTIKIFLVYYVDDLLF